MPPSDDKFSYGGHLVFNEVCRTNDLSDGQGSYGDTVNDAEAKLLDVLPEFGDGNPRSPAKGYERLLIRDFVEDSKLPPETRQFVRSLVSLQYKYEEYDTTEGYVDGEMKEVEVPTVKDSNVFWDRDKYMIFRGAESDASGAKGQAQTAASEHSIQSITFSGDFLIWLFYRAHDDPPDLPGDLHIHRLTDAEVTGSPDDFGGEATIHESDDIKKSPAILLGILNNKKISKLEGDFRMDFDSENTESDYTKATLRTEIQRNKIQIKASKAGLKNAGQIEKLGLSSQMVTEIAKLYDRWEDMPAGSSDKFVPPTFIVELIKTCRKKDINYTQTPRNLLERQANKRDESLDDYDFSL